MERRARAAVLMLLAAIACSAPVDALTPGESLPAEWRPAGSGANLSVVWIFRTDDCLSCQAMDYSLRRLQGAYGRRVALVAVHVGREADAGIPAAFFASRRLQTAAAVDVSPRTLRRVYGDVSLPVLLLVRGDTIAWSSVTPGEPRLTPERIDSVFAAALGGSTSAAERSAGPAPGTSVGR